MEKIAYEKHPITRERKAELRAQGFIIVDARFKPANAQAAQAEAPADPKPASDVRALLTTAGVKFHHKTSDAKLAEMHAAFTRSGLSGESWNLLSDADRAQYFEAK